MRSRDLPKHLIFGLNCSSSGLLIGAWELSVAQANASVGSSVRFSAGVIIRSDTHRKGRGAIAHWNVDCCRRCGVQFLTAISTVGRISTVLTRTINDNVVIGELGHASNNFKAAGANQAH